MKLKDNNVAKEFKWSFIKFIKIDKLKFYLNQKRSLI